MPAEDQDRVAEILLVGRVSQLVAIKELSKRANEDEDLPGAPEELGAEKPAPGDEGHEKQRDENVR